MEAYLLHDANAGSNLKLMIMIQEEGMKGYGIYWTVLEFHKVLNQESPPALLFRVPIGYVSFNACHVMFLFEVAFVGNKGSSSHVEAAVLLSVGYQCISVSHVFQ